MIQGVLDLFGSWLPTPSPSAATPAPKPGPRSQTPPMRRILLGAQDVPYSLTRVKRRSIGMLVGAQGLEVRAPRWVTLHEIESALLEKADWILRKLQETQLRHAQLQATRIDWRDGSSLLYLGQTLRLSVSESAQAKRVHTALEADAEARVLRVTLPTASQPMNAGALQEAVQAWMKQAARVHFRDRLDHFAPLLGVQWHTLALSNAQTRWGSAGRTREGRAAIRLNWRLMQHRPEVIDYVVVHELSHLRVMDHSPRFWSTVASVMPDYDRWRRLLRDEPLPPWS